MAKTWDSAAADTRGWLAATGILAAAVVLAATRTCGIGLTPDSICYVSAARHLLAGEGYVLYDNSPYVLWPPLFPALLAFVGFFGVDPLVGARYANALLFGLIVFLTGSLIERHARAQWLSVPGAALVLLSAPLLLVSFNALSEPLFTFLAMASLGLIARPDSRRMGYSFFFAAAIAALAFLTRYLGCVLIGACLLTLLARARKWPFRAAFQGGVFAAISVGPTALWLARNYALTSSLAGRRFPPPLTAWGNTLALLEAVAQCFLPEALPPWVKIGALVAGAAAAVAALYACGIKVHSHIWKTAATPMFTVMALFAALYGAALVALASWTGFDRISLRLLAPAAPPAIVAAAILCDQMAAGVSPAARRRLFCLLAAMFFPAIAGSAFRTALWVKNRMADGAGGYATVDWRRSEMANYLAKNDIGGALYCNDPRALYILAGKASLLSPRKLSYTGAALSKEEDEAAALPFAGALRESGGVCVIWFDGIRDEQLCGIEAIAAKFACSVETVRRFPDGAIYRVSARGKQR